MINRVAARWVSRIAKGSDKPIYIAVFLPPMEQARLFKRFGKSHPNLLAHHMTIWYQDDGIDPKLISFPFGKTVKLKVVGYAENDKVQVVIVNPPTSLRPKGGRIPHITLSTAFGVSPKESNAILSNPNEIVWEPGLLTIEGKIGWWDGEKERFDFLARFSLTSGSKIG